MGAVDTILGEIKRGKVWPVYLLLGEDRGAKQEVVDALKKTLFGNEEDVETGSSVFFGDEAEVHEILETVATSSIFSDKRLVLVHD